DPVGIEDVDANACNGPVGANEPGGITLKAITNLEINLGPGRNHFTIQDTPAGTLTRVNTGRGDDLVDIKKVSGHTFVNGGAGSDTFNVHNDQQKLSDIAALLTLSGDSPQANVVTLANGSPQQGTAILAVNAIQRLTIEATGGSFVLTYAPTPLGLSASQAFDAGTLAAGTYFYKVTAIMPGAVETLASPETFAVVTANGAVDLAWYPVPFATGYRVYRGTTPGGENQYFAASGTSFTDTGAAGTAGSPPVTSAAVQSATVAYGAPATGAGSVQAALAGMGLIGSTLNVDVTKAGDVYDITFKGAMAGTAIALLLTDPGTLLSGAGDNDTLNLSDSGSASDDA